MKKMNLLLMLALLLAMSFSTATPVSACEGEGCTPGYWKQEQHFDSWGAYKPDDNFRAVFGFQNEAGDWVGIGPPITLLEALSAKRQDFGSGDEAALVRHAVAALLNASNLDEFWTQERVIRKFVYAWKNPEDIPYWHAEFERVNELGCPLN